MVTRDDVISAYRMILGREPENEQVIEAHICSSVSVADLRSRFFNSPEFFEQSTSQILVGRHYAAPPMYVDMTTNASLLERMHAHTSEVWKSYGKDEPFWSVLTLPEFKRQAMSDDDIERFYRTGQDSLTVVRSFFDRNHQSVDAVQEVLEFGCGLGRVTFALANIFPVVVGVDISTNHLSLAQRRKDQIGARSTTFVHIASINGLKALPHTDFFYSSIVLQHNPPPIIAATLKILLNNVREDGFALFQVPTYKVGYSFDSQTYLDQPCDVMEMHVIESRLVFSILGELGFDVLEVQEDYCVGSAAFVSQTFFARRSRLTRR